MCPLCMYCWQAGRSALLEAAAAGLLQPVKCLVLFGADPLVKDTVSGATFSAFLYLLAHSATLVCSQAGHTIEVIARDNARTEVLAWVKVRSGQWIRLHAIVHSCVCLSHLSVWCWQEQAFGAVAAAGATDVDAVSREVASITLAEVSCFIVPTNAHMVTLCAMFFSSMPPPPRVPLRC